MGLQPRTWSEHHESTASNARRASDRSGPGVPAAAGSAGPSTALGRRHCRYPSSARRSASGDWGGCALPAVRWLTTGPRTRQFERAFAEYVGATRCGGELVYGGLALGRGGLGPGPGQAVLVPTLTFAATAEVVRYQGAVPLLSIATGDAEHGPGRCPAQARTVHLRRTGGRAEGPCRGDDRGPRGRSDDGPGGGRVVRRAPRLWVVEDAAHALPSAWRKGEGDPWRPCGQNTASVSCFSFYANKTITTGEGGMAVTAIETWRPYAADVAARPVARRLGPLQRCCGWDYRVLAPVSSTT